MKIVELYAERMKLFYLLSQNNIYLRATGRAFRYEEEVPDECDEQQIRENYVMVQKLLKKLDDMENSLNEVDGRTYVKVMGNCLSIATARKYLSQFSHIYDDGMGVFSYRDFPYYGFDNIRWRALDACCVSKKEEVIFDPLHLKERSKEFEEKKIDWYLKLKVAVAVSDATTDVEIKE